MNTVLNKIKVNSLTQPVFLGKDLSLQRYDQSKYPIFLKLFKDQMEFFWRPEEVSIAKDRTDFKNLSKIEEFIFTSNLQYQTLLDSVIGRGINLMCQNVSIPELEACMNTWQFFETIHSYSYTYIINNVYPEPALMFDSIIENKDIMKRAVSVSQKFDDLLSNPKDMKEAIYLALINTNILESVRFYVSFACAYYFAEQGKMLGNAGIIKLINRDENLHVAITQDLIKILRENKTEGFIDTIKEAEDKAVALFRAAVDEEKDWADYLFSRGPLLGLNSQILHGYIEWLANKRMESIGLPQIYNAPSNPIGGWLSNWVDSQKVQAAAQETTLLSYKVKSSISDLQNVDLGSI